MNTLNAWFQKWECVISKEKYVSVLFSNTNKNVQVNLDGVPLPKKEKHTFLGMIMDRKLTWGIVACACNPDYNQSYKLIQLRTQVRN